MDRLWQSGRDNGSPSVRETMNDWCDQQDSVPDGDRIYRCSKCGKRLHPRQIFGSDGEPAGWRLPPHKKKGHKLRAIKERQSKRRKEKILGRRRS
jgi:hypothetical protein